MYFYMNDKLFIISLMTLSFCFFILFHRLSKEHGSIRRFMKCNCSVNVFIFPSVFYYRPFLGPTSCGSIVMFEKHERLDVH